MTGSHKRLCLHEPCASSLMVIVAHLLFTKATPGGLRACRRVGQADRSALCACASSPAATEPLRGFSSPLGSKQKKTVFADGLFLFGDPRGIRTPVTAVKGRCPGPLDDGVIISDGLYILGYVSSVNTFFHKFEFFIRSCASARPVFPESPRVQG